MGKHAVWKCKRCREAMTRNLGRVCTACLKNPRPIAPRGYVWRVPLPEPDRALQEALRLEKQQRGETMKPWDTKQSHPDPRRLKGRVIRKEPQ